MTIKERKEIEELLTNHAKSIDKRIYKIVDEVLAERLKNLEKPLVETTGPLA